MSDQRLEKKSSLDSTVWNELDSPERSGCDGFCSPYDAAILQRLQFLTHRVQYLENKLANSLTGQRDDLSFGLSVNHQNDIPNVDIKVLSGPNKDSGQDENALGGWEDAIVERNTSFLIIPSADEQSTQTNSVSLQIRPLPNKTFVHCTNQNVSSNLATERTENSKDCDSEQVFADNISNVQNAVPPRANQEIRSVTNKMSKLTTSPKQDSNNNDLKYGYTVSISRSPIKDNVTENHPFSKKSLSRCAARKNGKDDTENHIDTGLDLIGNHKSHVFNSSYDHSNNVEIQVENPLTQENVCYQDVEICEVVKYEDNFDRYDRKIDLKIERRISNENCVCLQTNRRESISKQSINAKNSRGYKAEPNGITEKQALRKGDFVDGADGFCSHERLSVTGSNVIDTGRDMQIQESSPQAWKKFHCDGIDLDEALILENNGTPKKGSLHNKSYLKTNHFNGVGLSEHNDTTKSGQKYPCANKATIKKVRVRSVELPCTSSDDDGLPVSTASQFWSENLNRHQRLQRRKPRNKGAKVHHIVNHLEEFDYPELKGSAQGNIETSRYPVPFAVMSPNESGHVGSSASSSRDQLTDSTFKSASAHECTPMYTSSPSSSAASVCSPVQEDRFNSSPVHVLDQSTASPTGSELSYSKRLNDVNPSPSCNIGNGQLIDVLPGPTRLLLSDHSPTQLRLSEFLLASEEHSVTSSASSVVTNSSDLSDSFLDCQDEFCQCQTGISTENDFREELKSISRYVIEAGEKSSGMRKRRSMKRFFLDEEQGEMDIFGAKLQKREHKAIPLLVKVILRLRKHFFGGLEGPYSLKSLTPRQNKKLPREETNPREKKITFSPSAMLLSAVGESSASEIRDVIEKEGLDVNELSPSGKSLLHKAAASGNLESIHTLIQFGANVNLSDQDGFVPVHAALRKCHYKCAIFLVECGTDMTSYTRTRIQELAEINNMARTYKKTVLNTAL